MAVAIIRKVENWGVFRRADLCNLKLYCHEWDSYVNTD